MSPIGGHNCAIKLYFTTQYRTHQLVAEMSSPPLATFRFWPIARRIIIARWSSPDNRTKQLAPLLHCGHRHPSDCFVNCIRAWSHLNYNLLNSITVSPTQLWSLVDQARNAKHYTRWCWKSERAWKAKQKFSSRQNLNRRSLVERQSLYRCTTIACWWLNGKTQIPSLPLFSQL